MATYWSGTTNFSAGQTAIVETTVVASDDNGFNLTLLVDSPSLDRLCIWDGEKFICQNDAPDYLLGAENLNLYPEVRTYRVRVTFVSEAGGPTTAEWNIATGNATLESSSLTAA